VDPATRAATGVSLLQSLLAFLCVGLWAYLSSTYHDVSSCLFFFLLGGGGGCWPCHMPFHNLYRLLYIIPEMSPDCVLSQAAFLLPPPTPFLFSALPDERAFFQRKQAPS
jgi:hypothetical protein